MLREVFQTQDSHVLTYVSCQVCQRSQKVYHFFLQTHGETEAPFRSLGQPTAEPFSSLRVFCAQLWASLCFAARAWRQTQQSLVLEPEFLFLRFPAHIRLGRAGLQATKQQLQAEQHYIVHSGLQLLGTVAESRPGISIPSVPGSCAPSCGHPATPPRTLHPLVVRDGAQQS